VIVQKWDFRPGNNFVLGMQSAVVGCKRIIAVLSPEYLTSAYTAPEWAAGFADDPKGLKRKLVPVRVAECKPDGLLKNIVYIDLVGSSMEKVAQDTLPEGVTEGRAKPCSKPDFPGKKPTEKWEPVISEQIKRLGLEQAVRERRWPYRWELPPGGD
jgi:TIR domain